MQRDLIRGLMMAAIAALALGACDKEKIPLPGERVSVLQLNRDLVVDPTLADTPVKLPKPYVNDSWPQVGGNQAHAMYHLASGEGALGKAWSADIGSGASDENRLLAEPIIADGMVFTLDSESLVSAFSAGSGGKAWSADLTPDDDDDDLFGGGLAVAEGKVFVITGFVEGISLNQTGKTASDHVASLISGEDCSVRRYTKTGNYCMTAAELAQEDARLHKPYEGSCYKRRGGVVCDDAADATASSEISVYP